MAKRILLGILVAVIVIGGFLFYKWNTVEAKLEEELLSFFELLQEGKVEEAYEMTGETLKEITTFEDFEAMFGNEAFRLYESSEWNMIGVQYNQEGSEKNGVANFSGTLTIEGGEEVPAAAQFNIEDDEWKLGLIATGTPAEDFLNGVEPEEQPAE